jgi:hypothetical protein
MQYSDSGPCISPHCPQTNICLKIRHDVFPPWECCTMLCTSVEIVNFTVTACSCNASVCWVICVPEVG